MCTWKHVHLWTLTARNSNMVALFSELSKTFKRKRFQGENALFLFISNVNFFVHYLTLIFRVWFHHQNRSMYGAFQMCCQKILKIRSRIRKKISCSERDKQQTFSIISQYITSCYKQISGINCESCKFDCVA